MQDLVSERSDRKARAPARAGELLWQDGGAGKVAMSQKETKEPAARIEIWESGARLPNGKWRLNTRELVYIFKPGNGSCYFLRNILPLSDKTALWTAARLARASGMKRVYWHHLGNRNMRVIEGVIIYTLERDK